MEFLRWTVICILLGALLVFSVTQLDKGHKRYNHSFDQQRRDR